MHRIPENGGPTTNGRAKIKKWLGDTKWDVIHFNWGLHDIKMDAGKHQVSCEYEKNLQDWWPPEGDQGEADLGEHDARAGREGDSAA